MASNNRGGTKSKSRIRYFDYSMMVILIVIVCFGLVMLYSASSYSALNDRGDSMYYLKKQVIFCGAGFVVMWFVSLFDYHLCAKYVWFIYYGSIGLMLLVHTPLGMEINGAKRWINLGGISFQPAEVAKIAVILLIPALVCQAGKKVNKRKVIQKIGTYGLALGGVVYFLTDNLSTAIIVVGISVFVIFVAYKNGKWFAFLATMGCVGYVLLRKLLSASLASSSSFRLRRIAVWLNPESYSSEGGYQIMQGLYAIGSGGFLGKGLGNSAQKMLIPEAQNDMILSIICEELGLVGAVVVLVMFGLLLYRLMYIAQNAPDLYGALVAAGIFSHIAIQVILNYAVVTNLIPTTGITLPFISYGGTSILFLMIEMGIALSVSRRIKMD